jgi:hypothetical protein
MTATPKPWYTSKTLWVNIIVALVAILELFNVLPVSLPEGAGAWVLFAQSALNIILRVVTDQPLTLTGSGKDRRTIDKPNG